MHTIANTIIRNGSYYYNLRVPKQFVVDYGISTIRFKICDVSDCKPNYISVDDVEKVVRRLTPLIMGSLRTGSKLDYKAAARSLMPKSTLLSEMMQEYLSVRDISEKPVKIAVKHLIAVAGDREITDYTREDVRVFLSYMRQREVKTATVRRKLNSLSAIFNYSYAELDIERRNPWTRVVIPQEGKDVDRRGSFTVDQLLGGYKQALSSSSNVQLLFPILGETGCRLAEVVGLKVGDVDLDNRVLHIRPNEKRRLKTVRSERSLPLTPTACLALSMALEHSDDEWLFPRYIKEDGCYATHASNALAKWTKRRWNLTAHSLRHTFRDRLRAAEVPLEAIDQLGGWSLISSIGSSYGKGYSIDHLRRYMDQVAIT
ncbi:tyrosine recombinase XerC [Nereida sp. NH-UV-3]|uniref:site-specific integrase n=1 Tax=Nereida TaxID=282198 RepID=UPI0036F35CA5